MQRILYQRPSGKISGGTHFTHRLQSVLIADTNSVIKKQTILAQIKETARTAIVDPDGEKYISLYYSGHGEENTGNWVFKDGVITLQEVLDQISGPLDWVKLTIYADCCYSGNWCRILEKGKVQKKCKDLEVYIWAACAHDELATENVFTGLLKGQLPDYGGFEILCDLKGKEIGEEQTLTYAYEFI